jgi:hypothetical protein
LFRINNRFRMRYRFKPLLYRKVQSKIPIPGRMRALLRSRRKPVPRRLLRAYAFQNPPRLLQPRSRRNHVVNLVPPRKRTSIKKHHPPGVSPKKISGGLHHEQQTEIILPRLVLNLLRKENRMPDLILAQHPPGGSRR